MGSRGSRGGSESQGSRGSLGKIGSCGGIQGSSGTTGSRGILFSHSIGGSLGVSGVVVEELEEGAEELEVFSEHPEPLQQFEPAQQFD